MLFVTPIHFARFAIFSRQREILRDSTDSKSKDSDELTNSGSSSTPGSYRYHYECPHWWFYNILSSLRLTRVSESGDAKIGRAQEKAMLEILTSGKIASPLLNFLFPPLSTPACLTSNLSFPIPRYLNPSQLAAVYIAIKNPISSMLPATKQCYYEL